MAELAAEEVAPTLQRIGAQLLVRGWLSANNIVFAGDEKEPAAVVDTGYVSHVDQTIALVRHALGGKPLEQIVNTHLHSDHCGGNAGLQRHWPAARIAVPHGYQGALTPWDEAQLSYRRTGQRCEVFVPDRTLLPGTEIQLGPARWQIHSAPGHDPEAVLFFEPVERVLISGDALWQERLAIIFPELSGEAGFEAAHEALNLIEDLRPRVVLPGHGNAFTDVADAIAQSRGRLDIFARYPERHRKHAARALVMYHMLEVQQVERVQLQDWIVHTPVFGQALECEHDKVQAMQLAAETVDSLVVDGLLHEHSGKVLTTQQ